MQQDHSELQAHLVERGLRSIKSLAPRKCKTLKQVCQDELNNNSHSSELNVQPFFMALESKQPKVMEAALNTFVELFTNGVCQGPAVSRIIDAIQEVAYETSNDAVQRQILRSLGAAVSQAACEVHGRVLQQIIDLCYYIHLQSKSAINQSVAKATLSQVCSIVFQRMENFDRQLAQQVQNEWEQTQTRNSVSEHNMYPSVWQLLHFKSTVVSDKASKKNMNGSDEPPVSSFNTVLHKDAFQVFHELCKRCSQIISKEDQESKGLERKILSLEMVLATLNSAGPTFHSHEKFIMAIRNDLCMPLLNNCIDRVAEVADLSLNIFVVLIRKFKQHLKDEMEVFIDNIFLQIINSPNSSDQHKTLVLQVFETISHDPGILEEIFLNYDCDWDSSDLFDRIVQALAKAAKGRGVYAHDPAILTSSSSKEAFAVKEWKLQIKSLECLVAMVGSLKETILNVFSSGLKSGTAMPDRNISLDENPRLPQSVAVNKIQMEVSNEGSSTTENEFVKTFDGKQRMKHIISDGILKFNLKPRSGIAYLISNAYLEKTPTSVANFLHDYSEELDKTVTGDYLGQGEAYENGFCIRVLHAYVDLIDFTGMEFDIAIRHFLTGFRLPGEAQKIDRIMEKFAERYCITNPDVFPSADTAFVLAFSVIMLQTDLHNPSIREDRKMDKPGFIRNNRGINAGANLPDEFLGAIYDRIASNPISLKEDEEARLRLTVDNSSATGLFAVSAAVVDRQRQEAFEKERENMISQSKALFKRETNGPKSNGPDFISVQDAHQDHIRKMFDILWAPLFATCSVLLEKTEDPVGIRLCLKGYVDAINLSAIFGTNFQRDSSVQSLCRFSGLSSDEIMTRKHFMTIKAVLDVAEQVGDWLMESWEPILQCISHLDRLQMLASGADHDEEFSGRIQMPTTPSINPARSGMPSNTSPATSVRSRSDSSVSSHGLKRSSTAASTRSSIFSPGFSQKANIKTIEETNRRNVLIQSQLLHLEPEKMFAKSVSLNDEAIEYFVQSLKAISLAELHLIGSTAVRRTLVTQSSTASASPNSIPSAASQLPHPRVYCMLKLVEVADMNMSIRSRLVWKRIWDILSSFFKAVGLHSNCKIAMHSMDCLRQLSMKFLLETIELRQFHFQSIFLRPFYDIFESDAEVNVKEYIIGCVSNLILARGKALKSGWNPLLSVFQLAAEEPDSNNIIQTAFQSIQVVLNEHFEWIVQDYDVFVLVIRTLITFGGCRLIEISLKSIYAIELCFRKLATGFVFPFDESHSPGDTERAESTDGTKDEGGHIADSSSFTFENNSLHQRLWWAILEGLSELFIHDDRHNVRCAAASTLFQSLSKYGHMFSVELFFSIFQSILLPALREEASRELVSYKLVFKKFILLFGEYYESLDALLPLVLQLVRDMVTSEHKTELSTHAVHCLGEFLEKFGRKLNLTRWNEILYFTQHNLQLIQPTYLKPADSIQEDISYPESVYPKVWEVMKFKLSGESNSHSLSEVPLHLITRVQVTVEILHMLGNAACFHADLLLLEQADLILQMLTSSYTFARRVNDDLAIRQLLYDKGVRYPKNHSTEYPNLLPQELSGKIEAIRVFIALDYQLNNYQRQSVGIGSQDAKLTTATIYEHELKRLVSDIVYEYIEWSSDQMRLSDQFSLEYDRFLRLSAYEEPICTILDQYSQLSLDQLKYDLDWLVPLSCALITAKPEAIRVKVQHFVRSRLAQFMLPTPASTRYAHSSN